MSAIDLLILGEILLKPQSSYEMARFIQKNELNNVVKVSTPAVYKNILKLAEKGFLISNSQKDCDTTEKRIYHITENGMYYFKQLLIKTSKKNIPFHFDFNSVVVNLINVDKSEGIKLLENIETELVKNNLKIQQAIEKYNQIPFAGQMIIEQHRLINEALLTWIRNIRDRYITQK